jgi:hypothetical protein
MGRSVTMVAPPRPRVEYRLEIDLSGSIFPETPNPRSESDRLCALSVSCGTVDIENRFEAVA